MNKETVDDASTAIAKVIKMIDDDKMVIFTPSEAAALKEMALLWSQIKATVSLGSSIGSIMKWIVVFIAAWAALKAGFFDWIKEGLGKP